MKCSWRIRFGSALTVAAVLAFAGALLWARGRDPYAREWFTVKVPGGPAVRCLAVLPKPVKPRPVVVFLHGTGGTLVNDGRDLRRLAECAKLAAEMPSSDCRCPGSPRVARLNRPCPSAPSPTSAAH